MEQTILSRNLANIGYNLIIRYRYSWLIIVLLLVLLAGYGIRDLRLDSSNESFLPDSDPLFLANEAFEDQFGNEEFVFVLVHSEDMITHESLSRLRALAEDLKANLPFVEEAGTITNMEYLEVMEDELQVDDLISDKIPDSTSELSEIRRKLQSSQLYLDRFVTGDFKNVGIMITFEVMPEQVWVKAEPGFSPLDQVGWPDDAIKMKEDIFYFPDGESGETLVPVVDARKLIAPALNVILKRHRWEGFEIMATGVPIGDFEGDVTTTSEGGRVGLIALIAAFCFMLFLFRNLAGVVAPLVVMVYTVIILFGTMGWFGIPVSMGSIFVAPLLMVLSVSYSIHFINHFNFFFQRKGNRLQSVHYAYAQALWPCFLTAVTTAIGFGSFLIVSMKPIRDVGIACAAGTLISYILVMILVPVAYSFESDRKTERKDGKDSAGIFPRGMVPLADSVLAHWKSIVLISFLTLAFSGYNLLRMPIETDFMEVLGENNSFVRQTREMTEKLGSFYSYEVLIEFQEEGSAKKPSHLAALAELAEEASRWDQVDSTMSLVDLVKEINSVMQGRRPGSYTIPDNQQTVAQLLLLYEISGGEELDDWVDYNYRKLRLSVQLSSNRDLGNHLEMIEQKAKSLFPEHTGISIIGDVPILIRLMDLLVVGQLKSILLAFGVITLVMVLILRSLRAGLLSMIPNLFPVVVVAGIMGLFQINLDFITIMIAPMIIGIAVDDTVHFFIHFKQELSGFRDYEKANRQTFVKIGYALLFTTLVLSIGFGILGFSSVAGITHMGFLAASGILAALIADFFIAPILLVYLKPYKGVLKEPRHQN